MASVYTRQGKVEKDFDRDYNYQPPYRDFRQYRFPIRANTDKEIRINVPTEAVKADITEIIEHLQVIANNMEG